MIVELCRQFPMLADIPAEALDRYYTENRIRLRHCAKGATVHRQHERCTALDLVASGSLAAYALAENGSAMGMFTFQKGGLIGANLLFGDRNEYPLNIYCMSKCSLLQIDRDVIVEFLHDNRFVMGYVRSLSMNAQGMNQRISMLTLKTLRENLLDYLWRQSVLQGTKTVALPISKKQLADFLGVQRPSLFRELKKLKDEGLINVRNREITLCTASEHAGRQAH